MGLWNPGGANRVYSSAVWGGCWRQVLLLLLLAFSLLLLISCLPASDGFRRLRKKHFLYKHCTTAWSSHNLGSRTRHVISERQCRAIHSYSSHKQACNTQVIEEKMRANQKDSPKQQQQTLSAKETTLNKEKETTSSSTRQRGKGKKTRSRSTRHQVINSTHESHNQKQWHKQKANCRRQRHQDAQNKATTSASLLQSYACLSASAVFED